MIESIHPSSIITNCTIGEWVTIGPFCMITDTALWDNVAIEWNVRIEKSTLGNSCEILWWAIIRESTLGEWCVIGGEVKKSKLGKHNKAKHPGTTVVSTTSGEKVNFWWGLKCANYDGTGKGTFIVGNNVFLGCNSVISVKAGQTTTIHDGVKIGANIHISGDIPAHSLVYQDRETGKVTVREGYYAGK